MPERGTPIDWEAIHEADRQEIRARAAEKQRLRDENAARPDVTKREN